LVENTLRANIAQMPDLITDRRKIDNILRQLVMRVRENKDFCHGSKVARRRGALSVPRS